MIRWRQGRADARRDDDMNADRRADTMGFSRIEPPFSMLITTRLTTTHTYLLYHAARGCTPL